MPHPLLLKLRRLLHHLPGTPRYPPPSSPPRFVTSPVTQSTPISLDDRKALAERFYGIGAADYLDRLHQLDSAEESDYAAAMNAAMDVAGAPTTEEALSKAERDYLQNLRRTSRTLPQLGRRATGAALEPTVRIALAERYYGIAFVAVSWRMAASQLEREALMSRLDRARVPSREDQLSEEMLEFIDAIKYRGNTGLSR